MHYVSLLGCTYSETQKKCLLENGLYT